MYKVTKNITYFQGKVKTCYNWNNSKKFFSFFGRTNLSFKSFCKIKIKRSSKNYKNKWLK